MTTFLVLALLGMTAACVVLALVNRRLWAMAESDRENHRSQLMYLEDACRQSQRFQTEIAKIMRHYTGGIIKRLRESREVAQSIQTNAPELFKKDSSLLYCLHANDQFLARLYGAAGDCIDGEYGRQFRGEDEDARVAVFFEAYESAGLPVPPFAAQERA